MRDIIVKLLLNAQSDSYNHQYLTGKFKTKISHSQATLPRRLRSLDHDIVSPT